MLDLRSLGGYGQPPMFGGGPQRPIMPPFGGQPPMFGGNPPQFGGFQHMQPTGGPVQFPGQAMGFPQAHMPFQGGPPQMIPGQMHSGGGPPMFGGNPQMGGGGYGQMPGQMQPQGGPRQMIDLSQLMGPQRQMRGY